MMSEVALPVRQPFDFDHLLAFLAARAIPGLEDVSDGAYRRGALEVCYDPQSERLRISGSFEPDLVESVRRVFAVDIEPAPIMTELGRHRLLAGIRRGIRVPGAWDGFELTIRAIVGQQISVAGARTILGRIVATFGMPNDSASSDFPSPQSLIDARFETLGLTGSRAETLRQVARLFAEGRVSSRCGAAFASGLPALREVRGIGEWTIGYLAMRGALDPDAYPAGDLVLRKAFGSPLISARDLAREFERWHPWRAYAAMALWDVCG